MKKQIGPYTLYRRTDYSKFQVLDELENPISDDIADKIIEDYIEQTSHPDRYFKIKKENILEDYESGGNIEYAFLPDEIKMIATNACAFSGVKYISFPDSLTYVAADAFRNCKELKEVVFPISMQCLGNSVFQGCENLKKVVIPEGIKEIPIFTFEDCKNLNNLYIPDSVKMINSCAFKGCDSLSSINMPRDIEGFGQSPFGNSGITTIRFNHSIPDHPTTDMGYCGFLENSSILKMEIDKSVKYITPNLFRYALGNPFHVLLPTNFSLPTCLIDIDYFGSNSDFSEFRKNNKELLKLLKHSTINIMGDLDTIIENKSIKEKIKDIFFDKER